MALRKPITASTFKKLIRVGPTQLACLALVLFLLRKSNENHTLFVLDFLLFLTAIFSYLALHPAPGE